MDTGPLVVVETWWQRWQVIVGHGNWTWNVC